MLADILSGFQMNANLDCILMIAFGTLLGIIIGALPGLTATTGVSIFLPLTFYMDPVPALGFLGGIYCGGMYGGSITAILINTPGTPAGAATVLDGHPLAQKGEAYKALQMALYASVIGGLISCIALMFFAPILASAALKFSYAEYFALGVFGLSIVAGLSNGNIFKGLLACCIGLLIGCVGMDPISGFPRLTFGYTPFLGGFQLIPVLIGLFAMSELIKQCADKIKRGDQKDEIFQVSGKPLSKAEWKRSIMTILKGSIIGTFIGAVPATGGGTAAFLSYGEARRASKHPEEFGHGSIEGVAASESANNGATGGTFIPMLYLGIPGDSVTAVMMGALIIQGLTPGPNLFVEHASTVNGIYVALLISNIFMLAMGQVGLRWFYKVCLIPKEILQPIIFGLCCVGSYASNSSLFDVGCMFAFGILGYLLLRCGIPMSPILLGLILGNITESNLRRGMLASGGSFLQFINRPICLVILAFTVFSLAFTIIRMLKDKAKGKEINEEE